MGEYFGRDVDGHIKTFCECTDIAEKNKLFEEKIRGPLTKLIEGQSYTYGFNKIPEFEELKNDCLSTLYELLPKFDHSKGKKAFSYFNVIVRNWFVWKIREGKKNNRMASSVLVESITSGEVANHEGHLLVEQPYEQEVIDKEFVLSLQRNMESWREILVKKTEKQVLEAIIFMFQNADMIPIYNKKAIYLYIREITGLTTKQIIAIIRKMRDLYYEFKEKFDNGEEY